MTSPIPFNRPSLGPAEYGYLHDALEQGHFSGDGRYTKACNALLEEALESPKVLLTTSCTHALEMSALLLDLEPGDEVVVPAFTFVSTVNAFVLHNADPVFIDIRPDTLNLDESLLESVLTPRTRAVVPVHYAGVGAEMDSILSVLEPEGIATVEDNAHGLFGRYRGRALGTFGKLATQSFHETKNFSCGEGGALVVNDRSLGQRAEVIREKGTNRSRFFRGQVDKYTWVDKGSSYLPSDLLAAILLGQLERRSGIQRKRETIWRRYDNNLADWAHSNGVCRPTIPEHCDQTYHMYYLLFHDLEERTAFIDHMGERGILTPFHYQPLHLSEMGKRFGGRAGQCPVAEEVANRIVRLPLFNDLRSDEQDRVIDATLAFGS